MSKDEYSHESFADLPGVPFAIMRHMILQQAEAAKLPVLADEPGELTVQTNHGLIGLRNGTNEETAGMVAAKDARWLFVMKNAVVQQMQSFMPEVAEAMQWSDGDTVGALPPNFQFMQVKKVEPLGPVFLRVTLQGEDLSSYGDASIHFRLLQPPKDAEPEWPGLAANGSIEWPTGPGAPHKPVYTARWVNHDDNTLATDVYIHDGGRTTEWAQEVMNGGRSRSIIGLVGPAGGGLMEASHVFMATDETGFPAAARILENLPKDSRGEILLEAEEGEACDYPIEAPDGIKVQWLARSRGEHLGQAALAALPDHAGASIWFAGEQKDAKALREAAKTAGWEQGSLRISGFWRAAD